VHPVMAEQRMSHKMPMSTQNRLDPYQKSSKLMDINDRDLTQHYPSEDAGSIGSADPGGSSTPFQVFGT